MAKDMKENNRFDDFVALMARLRNKDGCPWDREQTHQSLKPNLIEEAHETIEAIDSGDPRKLKEELGDLFLQVLFHAQIAEERKEFNIHEVIETIMEKLVRRHPHVFGDSKAEKSSEVLEQWEEIKRKEKGYEDRKSARDGIPKTLPSLMQAHVVQDKASRVGFDWEHVDQVFEKVEEEMGEFRDAFSGGDASRMEDELGDLLFALVNIARFIEINPEDALKKTIVRFKKRFEYIEESVRKEGEKLSSLSLEEMEGLWEKAKEEERT